MRARAKVSTGEKEGIGYRGKPDFAVASGFRITLENCPRQGNRPRDIAWIGYTKLNVTEKTIENFVPSRIAANRKVFPLHNSGSTSWKPKSATTARAASHVIEAPDVAVCGPPFALSC